MKSIQSLAWLGALVALMPAAAHAQGSSGPSADRVRVIVAHHPGQRGAAQRALHAARAAIHRDFPDRDGFAVTLSRAQAEALARNPAVAYVEEDVKRYPLGHYSPPNPMFQEVLPYGIGMVQADQVALPGGGVGGKVKVCVIDSGYDLGHRDLPDGSRVTGDDDSSTGSWSEDRLGHGTHVAGTIAAIHEGTSADAGVVGVLRGDIPLHVVKVFNETEDWAYSSNLVAAIDKCKARRANGERMIINMSLGSEFKSRFEEQALKRAYDEGFLLVAAAGNDGNGRRLYPASYPTVISVAAVDQSMARASFSQRNGEVELTAPGVDVWSTVPRDSAVWSDTAVNGHLYASDPLEEQREVPDSGSGALVSCGIATQPCGDAGGKVCLIERGRNTFYEKVRNCEIGGGVAAIIYNDVAGPFTGTMGDAADKPAIPAVSISREDGLALLSLFGQPDGATATVTLSTSHYGKISGTSMSTPHVSGVAALVWAHRPECTNVQVRNLLAVTAKDLGSSGRDDSYGHGLVQARAAHERILQSCDAGSTGEGGGKGGPKGSR